MVILTVEQLLRVVRPKPKPDLTRGMAWHDGYLTRVSKSGLCVDPLQRLTIGMVTSLPNLHIR